MAWGHHIIIGDQYESYSNALKQTNLETLEARRDKFCTKFAKRQKNMTSIRSGSSPNPKYIQDNLRINTGGQ